MSREFGLIGRGISHSFSAEYFTRKFERENIDATYSLFDIPRIEDIIETVRNKPRLVGFNITSPYKRTIIPFLDAISPQAKELQAVNVVKILRNDAGDFKLEGFNTDSDGFLSTLSLLNLPTRSKALILGTGGAASAVAYALKRLDIPYIFVSRNPHHGDLQTVSYREAGQRAKEHNLIINATPLGTWPVVDKMPPLPLDNISIHHICYDLIYNPAETLFLNETKKRGAQTINGLGMLIRQAELSWEIWNER